MGFWFLTDLHWTDRQPQGRTDDYLGALERKLVSFVNEVDAGVVLFGGDFFDTPHVSDRALALAVSLVADNQDVQWNVVAGQHDLPGHNMLRLGDSSLGVLLALPNVHLLGDRPTQIDEDVWAFGASWREPLVTGVGDAERPRVLVAHATITERRMPFDTLVASEMTVDADLVLCGDVHAGLPDGTRTKNGVPIYNPGCAGRRAVTEALHVPSVLYVDFGARPRPWGFTVTGRALDAAHGVTVFDLGAHGAAKVAERTRDEWVSRVQEARDLNVPDDPQEMVEAVGAELAKPRPAIDDAKARIAC